MLRVESYFDGMDETTVTRLAFRRRNARYATIVNAVILVLIVLDLGYTYYLIWYHPWASVGGEPPDYAWLLQAFAWLAFASHVVFCYVLCLVFGRPRVSSVYAFVNGIPVGLMYVFLLLG